MSTQKVKMPGRSARYIVPVEVEAEYAVGLRHQKYLRQTRRWPYIKAGHRTILYDRVEIERYLAARRVEAIGQTVAL